MRMPFVPGNGVESPAMVNEIIILISYDFGRGQQTRPL